MRDDKRKLENAKLKAQNAILTKQKAALLEQKKFVKKIQKQLNSVDESCSRKFSNVYDDSESQTVLSENH